MKLSAPLKRILDALACAHAGEFLSDVEKFRVLAKVPVSSMTFPRQQPAAIGPQVGLYLVSEPPKDVMQYALDTCERLGHGLTVFSFQSGGEIEETLAPYRNTLTTAGVALRVVTLTGEPPAPLAQALRRHPEVTFLVCNESGYLGNSLVKGRVRRDSLPVPVVLVGSNSQAAPSESNTANATRVA